MILASAASLPPGMRLVGNALQITAPYVFADPWSFEGLEVFADADVTFTRASFHNPVNAHFLHVGENGTAPKVTVIGGDMNGADLKGDTGEAAVQIASGSFVTLGCNWHDGVRDYITKLRGSWASKGDRFTLAGKGVGALSHVDGVLHDYGGDTLIDGAMIDFRLNGQPLPDCGWTASAGYFQAKNAPITAKVRNSVILGAADLGLLYPFQTNERAFGVLLDLRGNVIEPGAHGKTVGDTPAAGGKLKLTGANNVNATTGQPLALAAL